MKNRRSALECHDILERLIDKIDYEVLTFMKGLSINVIWEVRPYTDGPMNSPRLENRTTHYIFSISWQRLSEMSFHSYCRQRQPSVNQKPQKTPYPKEKDC